ncbi:SAM-dependent methyltransferase [Actinomycetospora termitidis]|uniref:Methyltransferase domain-containing protein n=1 Tax=Actinomycetospora termitidis TaxID=3053470 RepID=A0ABT7MHL1_9PSEU|nr:methyltransferase domain-containing protein [Actinomycetospora sp. Odt1-22]MDL5160141.1 methyltransferase domain-containing protein [Actinomycetospora sp. Odt1-22]
MLRYAGAVAASKAFSATAVGRRVYHHLGRQALERLRVAEGLPQRYVDRADRLLAQVARHDVLAPGDRVLEIGTGWVHWEATVLALHHDVRVTMLDVRDNRLPRAYRAYLAGYRAHLESVPASLAPAGRDRALDRLGAALDAPDLDGVYDLLGLEHVVEPTGSLAGLDAGRFALVVSADVLEHLPTASLAAHVREELERVRPGGYAIHQIDLVDHYHYFDPSTSPKTYYRYGDGTWRRWFQSEVQYFNRVQRPQWQALFRDAGWSVVEDGVACGEIGEVPIAAPFAALSPADRDCLQILGVHRRPA